jgi:hypothetical protein
MPEVPDTLPDEQFWQRSENYFHYHQQKDQYVLLISLVPIENFP